MQHGATNTGHSKHGLATLWQRHLERNPKWAMRSKEQHWKLTLAEQYHHHRSSSSSTTHLMLFEAREVLTKAALQNHATVLLP
jgi:hypothetical protein